MREIKNGHLSDVFEFVMVYHVDDFKSFREIGKGHSLAALDFHRHFHPHETQRILDQFTVLNQFVGHP
jgi:hypothetical protein